MQASSGVAERNGCGMPLAGPLLVLVQRLRVAGDACQPGRYAGCRRGVLFRSVCFRILEPIDSIEQVRHRAKLFVPFVPYFDIELALGLEDEFDEVQTVDAEIANLGRRLNPFGWHRAFRGYQLC